MERAGRNSRRGWARMALVVCALAPALLATAGQKKGPAGSVLVPEKGKLNILLDGKSIGQEEYEIGGAGSGWAAKGTSTVKPEGQPEAVITGSLNLQPNGAPVSYDWSTRTSTTNGAHVEFTNGVARMTLQMQGSKPFTQDLQFNTPMIVVLDNNLYHQYTVLAKLYDWTKRGPQSFSVLIPQELTPGTIQVEAAGPLSADGKSYEGLKVTTNDLQILLYLDNEHRLMRLEVPAAKVAVVRQ